MTTTNTYRLKPPIFLKKNIKSTIGHPTSIKNEPSYHQEIPPQPSKYGDLQAFFILNGSATQQFQIEADEPAVVKGQDGLTLCFEAHSFLHVSNQPVTGQITIRIKEVFSKSDLVLSNKPTTSQNRLLTSGGVFFLSATQRNLPLQLVRPAEVYLPIPEKGANPLILQVFKGFRSMSNPYEELPHFDWKKSTQSQVKFGFFQEKKSLKLTLKEMGWMNVSHFCANDSPRSMSTVQIEGLKKPLKEQVVFLGFKKLNSVMEMYRKDHKFSMYNVPNQEPATIISIGIDEKQQLYFGKQEVETISETPISLVVKPINEDLLVKICQGID